TRADGYLDRVRDDDQPDRGSSGGGDRLSREAEAALHRHLTLTPFVYEPAHVAQLRDAIRRFVEREMPREAVRPWARERPLPRDAFRRLAATGVCGLTVAEEHGGSGRDLVAAVAVIDELARRGTALAGPYIHCAFYGGINLSENGSPAQRRALLPRGARGELLLAHRLSPPDAGGGLASVARTAPRAPHRPTRVPPP